MKRYGVLLSYDVPYYVAVIVEADSHEEAKRLALSGKGTEIYFELEWDMNAIEINIEEVRS